MLPGLLAPPCVSVLVLALAGPAASGASKHVRATLAAEVASIRPGQPFTVGVRLEMDPHWHTYWKNPGDSGLPTRIRWKLPDGYSAGPIQWPRPERFPAEPLMSYGYDGEVWLLTEVRPPAGASGEAALGARVDWLECEEMCIPGKAELQIAVPVRASAPGPGEHASAIARSRAQVPGIPSFSVGAKAAPAALKLTAAGAARPKDAYFYPAAASVVEHALPQKLEPAPKGFALVLPRAANGTLPQSLDGVLELDGKAYEISTRVESEGGSDR